MDHLSWNPTLFRNDPETADSAALVGRRIGTVLASSQGKSSSFAVATPVGTGARNV